LNTSAADNRGARLTLRAGYAAAVLVGWFAFIIVALHAPTG